MGWAGKPLHTIHTRPCSDPLTSKGRLAVQNCLEGITVPKNSNDFLSKPRIRQLAREMTYLDWKEARKPTKHIFGDDVLAVWMYAQAYCVVKNCLKIACETMQYTGMRDREH